MQQFETLIMYNSIHCMACGKLSYSSENNIRHEFKDLT